MTKDNNKEERLVAARNRAKQENSEKRVVLLLANEKMKCEDLGDFYSFITFFTPIKQGFMQYVKFERVQQTIMDDYLVKIWIDENNIFHAEDMSKTDDWYEEAREIKRKRLLNAFGYCDESLVDLY